MIVFLTLALALVDSKEATIRFLSHSIDITKEPDIHGSPSSWYAKLAAIFWKPSMVSKHSNSNDNESKFWLLAVQSQLRVEQLKELETCLGMPLGPYIPDSSYLIYAPISTATQAKSCKVVKWVGAYPRASKYLGDLLRHSKNPSLDLNNTTAHDPRLIVQFPYICRSNSSLLQALTERLRNETVEAGYKDVEIQPAGKRAVLLIVGFVFPRITSASNTNMSLAELQALADLLSTKDYVYAIELPSVSAVRNYFARSLVMTGSTDPTVATLWDKGLTGANVTVGCADTGLDWDHPFFYDPLHLFGDDHRKIQAIYYASSLQTDAIDGHGTHVVGSILGAPLSTAPAEVQKFGGVARDAKLVFQHVGTPSGGLGVPPMETLFDQVYQQKVRIHSNSWGCGGGPTQCNAYTTQAHDIDQYVWDNKDFLVLFAAGNDGSYTGTVEASVGAPATAKNLIAVGASMNTNQALTLSSTYIDWTVRASDEGTTTAGCCSSSSFGLQTYCCQSAFQTYVSSHPDQNREVNLAPFSSRGPTWDGRLKPQIVAPGNNIISSKSDGDIYSRQCATSDSSPASCLLALEGTSMATPVTAGAAALVRQYFVQGWNGPPIQPSAALMTAVICNGAVPLTGAIDIYGNTEYSAITDLWPSDWETLGQTFPIDIFQGFGRMQLTQVLQFADSTHQLYTDDSRGVATGEDVDYCFTTTANTIIHATLAWTDYPAEVNAQNAAINNVDLIVGVPSSTSSNGYRAYAGNFMTKRDIVNNVEHVIFPPPPQNVQLAPTQTQQVLGANTAVLIKVRGYDIPKGETTSKRQPYALVVTGSFDPSKVVVGGSCSFSIDSSVFPAATFADMFPSHIPWVGIGVGCVIGLLALLCCTIVFFIFQKKRRTVSASNGPDSNEI